MIPPVGAGPAFDIVPVAATDLAAAATDDSLDGAIDAISPSVSLGGRLTQPRLGVIMRTTA